MKSGVRVLGLLPARGGSKGLPRKNVRLLHGRPLVAWAAGALARSRLVDRAICSTDDEEIAESARNAGLDIPWMRPAHLATDRAMVVEVIMHALQQLNNDGDGGYTHVALVQATSPTVTTHDIDAAIELAVQYDADTVITGCCALQHHPAMMFSLTESGEVSWLLSAGDRMARRQDLPPVFVRTGLVYVLKAQTVMEQGSIYGKKIFALIIPEDRALTIDTERDFLLAQFMLKG